MRFKRPIFGEGRGDLDFDAAALGWAGQNPTNEHLQVWENIGLEPGMVCRELKSGS